jgi:MSHA biogenesis protein MshN
LATLLDGVRIDAARYAAPAARLQSELGDATGALATLAAVPAAQRTAAHEALAGGLAYRAAQFDEAIAAYRRALAAPDAQPLWWLGLGLALEAAGQRAEAHAAFTRLAHAPALPADVQRFVAQRLAATAPAAARAAANPPAAADSLAASAAR